MLDVVAGFERSMIVERVKAGLKRARAKGKVVWAVRLSARLLRPGTRHAGYRAGVAHRELHSPAHCQ